MSGVFSADPALRDQWYVVALSTDVAAGPMPVELLGDRYVLWRPPGDAASVGTGAAPGRSVVAAVDRCPHREAPLSAGRVIDGGCLVCPYHGWTFDTTGACVRIPSSSPGLAVTPAARLSIVAVRELYGLVWLSPSDPAGEPPPIAEEADPSFRRINVGLERWSASATRMVDNFCDVAHFPFVHRATLGADVDEVVDRIHVEDLGDGFTGYRYSVDVDNAAGERVTQLMTTGFHLPFTVRSTTRISTGPDAGSKRVLLLCATPIDDHSSMFTFVVWRNSEVGPTDEEQLAFDRAVGAEDRAMLETIPGSLPLDVSATVNVQSDRLSVEWRRRLAALATPADPPFV